MANWIGHTNQKLYHARLLIDLSDDGSIPLAPASEDAALCLLREAWLSYLNELAVHAGFKSAVHSLADLKASVPLITGEITEVSNLSLQPGSWLSELQLNLEQQRLPKDSRPVTVSPGRIALKADDTLPLRRWWQGMSDLIDSQRQNRQES